jgi:hypothetical protein
MDIFEILDDDKLDREWIIRNILGGMSAGFGLRGTFYKSGRSVFEWLSVQ